MCAYIILCIVRGNTSTAYEEECKIIKKSTRHAIKLMFFFPTFLLTVNLFSVISTLEQATRGLIIIAAVLGFVAVVVSFVLGLRKLERAKGAYIIGGVYAFSGN